MNLPFVIDVAVGLIFIFLILSLLASEIQELLTTLLQWRAKHLKDAIEVLLAGGVGTKEEEQVRELVNKLYDDPLLRNINQEAKGLAGKARAVTRWLIPGNQRGSFGAHGATGPSYIAPETFATSILERLGLSTLAKKLVEVRLERFAKRITGKYTPNPEGNPRNQVILPNDSELENSWDKGRIRLIAEAANVDLHRDDNFKILVEEFNDTLNDFKAGETNLATSVERMGESFSTYIANYSIPESKSERADSVETSTNELTRRAGQINSAEETTEAAQPEELSQLQSDKPDLVYFAKRLRTLKLGTFGEKSERAIASGGLRPSLLEIAELLNRSSGTYQEVVDAYQNLVKAGKDLDKKVIPRLKYKLLTSHYVEVIEQELIASHLEEVAARLTEVLETRHPKWYQEFKGKLEHNDKQCGKAKADAKKPIRHRRGLLRRTRTWSVRQWRKITVSTPKAVQQKRHWIVTEMMDRLSEEEQKKLTKAVLKSVSNQKDKLYGEVEKGCFGVIDHALDRLTNEERHFLIDKVLTEMGCDNKQRSLYNNYQTYKTTQLILSRLPNSVKESFAILARRAQARVQQTGNDINQFQEEVAVWFDRSMSRASGVYKRNAKGVAIAIGLLLAILSNVDAAFVVDRLSNDENLRRVVTENAINLEATSPGTSQSATDAGPQTAEELRALKNRTNAVLQELSLPIGWNAANLSQQLGCSSSNELDELPSDWTELYTYCLTDQPTSNNVVKNAFEVVARNPLAPLRILFGWLIAGIAISMGAPFWFDLLGKVVNVRNSGGKPPSTETQSVAKPAAAEIAVRKEP